MDVLLKSGVGFYENFLIGFHKWKHWRPVLSHHLLTAATVHLVF